MSVNVQETGGDDLAGSVDYFRRFRRHAADLFNDPFVDQHVGFPEAILFKIRHQAIDDL